MKIDKVSNGFVVTSGDGENLEVKVIEEVLDDETKLICDLLHVVCENYGVHGGKRCSKNVNISLIPGYDYGGDIDDEYLSSLVELHQRLSGAISGALRYRKENNGKEPKVDSYNEDSFKILKKFIVEWDKKNLL